MLPWGLIGTILLVMAIEWSVARHSLELTGPEGWEWRLTGQAAKRKAGDADVLAIGSSMIKGGIVPQAIEPVLGRRVYNLGMCVGPPPATYFLLRRALDSGARPSAVLLEFHPHSLMESHWHPADFWPDFLDARECLELSWRARDARFFGAMTLTRLLPSLKDRHGIRARILAATDGKSSVPLGVLAMRRSMRKNRGAKIPPKNPDGPKVGFPPHELVYESRPWSCDRVNEDYVRRIFELAKCRGVRVVWLLPPIRPDLQHFREKNGLDGAFRAFARRMQERYPEIVLVDGTNAGYSADLFVDSSHLDRDGALAMSAELAPILRGLIDGNTIVERWVSLPSARARPEGVVIEDVGESVQAVLRLTTKPGEPTRRE